MGHTSRLRWFRRSLLLFFLFGGLAAGAKCSAPASAGPLDSLNSLQFVVRYQTAGFTGAECGEDRTKAGLIGKPMSLDLGGSAAPDVLIEVVAIPGVGNQPSRLYMTTTKLTTNSLRSLIEVVLNPGADSGRVAFGYDGCDKGTPKTFNASITSAATKLTLDTTMSQPGANLTILGSSFTIGPNSTRVNPTSLMARMTPVPQTLNAVVNMLPHDAYTATVTPSSSIELGVLVQKVSGAKTMALNGLLKTLKSKLDFDFNPSTIHYKTGAAFSSVKFNLAAYTPPTASAKGVTDRLDVNMTAVPREAWLTRTGKAIEFTPAKDSIGTMNVRYSSIEDGGTPLGALTIPDAPQYVAANLQPGSINAQAQILGLAHALIDTADPVVVDVAHTAGPLLMDITQAARPVVCDTCQIDPNIVTRNLKVSVLNMPAIAKVTYSPLTGSYTYNGSSVIGELTADVHSSEPLVDLAHDSHLRLVSVPTGLTGRINTVDKTFSAVVTQDTDPATPEVGIGTVEAQVTSGPDTELPVGTDGLLLNDREQSYETFVRISGLREAIVGWGETQFATLKHTAGPFQIVFGADDTGGHADEGVEVTANVLNLPDTVHIAYSPTADNSHFVYTGSDVISQVNMHVVREKPFMEDTDVTTLNTFIFGLPTYVELDVDTTAKTLSARTERELPDIEVHHAFVAPQATSIGSISVDLCSPTKCRGTQPGDPGSISNDTGVDGLWLNDLTSGYDMYARLSNVNKAELGWGDTITAGLTHTAAPFEAHTVADKIGQKRVIDSYLPLEFHFEDVAYTERADVIVHDLPQTVALTFNPLTTHATYTGSSPIASLTADYTKGPDLTVGGRAHFMRVVLKNVESGVVFDLESSPSNNTVTVDTGPAKIGDVLFQLTSNRTLLDYVIIKTLPVTMGTEDGVVVWDLLDDILIEYPFTDPFLVIGHGTNVSHFKFTDGLSTDSDTAGGTGTRKTKGVELTRVDTNKKITADIRTSGDDAQSAFAPFEPFVAEPFAHTTATVNNPPSTLGFTFTARASDPGSNGPTFFDVRTWGASAPTSSLNFFTNAGALSGLSADVSPLPAGTKAAPGAIACISPDSMHCIPAQYDPDDMAEDPFSADLKVTEPVHLAVNALFGETKVDIGLLVSKRLNVGKINNTDDFNSTLVYLNTDSTPIEGSLKLYNKSLLCGHGGSCDWQDDMKVTAPPGTRALHRHVEIERESINEDRNSGLLACPHDFDSASFFIGKFSLNDDLCTGPALHSVNVHPVKDADGRVVMDLYGTSFAADTEVGGQFFEGTHVDIYDADSGVLADYISDVTVSRDAMNHMVLKFRFNALQDKTIRFVLRPNTDVVNPPSASSGAGCPCPVTLAGPGFSGD